jgi:hypothetical protein
MTRDPYQAACYEGALGQLGAMLDERLKRLADLASRMVGSLEMARTDGNLSLEPTLVDQQQALIDRWPEMEAVLRAGPAPDSAARQRDAFLSAWQQAAGESYVKAVASLPAETKQAGTAWLQAIVDWASALWKIESR